MDKDNMQWQYFQKSNSGVIKKEQQKHVAKVNARTEGKVYESNYRWMSGSSMTLHSLKRKTTSLKLLVLWA